MLPPRAYTVREGIFRGTCTMRGVVVRASKDPIRRARRLRPLCWLVGALVVLAWSAAPASATVIEHNAFTQPYDYVFWDCGYAMSVAGTQSHVVQVRADKKLDGNVFVTDNYEFQETWTAPDGRYVTAENAGAAPLIANRTAVGAWEKFQVLTNADGSVSLKANANVRILRSQPAVHLQRRASVA